MVSHSLSCTTEHEEVVRSPTRLYAPRLSRAASPIGSVLATHDTESHATPSKPGPAPPGRRAPRCTRWRVARSNLRWRKSEPLRPTARATYGEATSKRAEGAATLSGVSFRRLVFDSIGTLKVAEAS